MSKSVKRLLVSTLVAVALALTLSGAAAADMVSGCSITIIALDESDAGLRLMVMCDGTYYYTNPGGTCPTATTDVVRLWESMAMAAMLAGKKVTIYNPTVAGCNTPIIGYVAVAK